jgi:hypothetical protein
VKLTEPGAYRVWALATSGKRLAQVPAKVDGNALVFTADVAGFKDYGAILSYEVARE